MGIQIINGGFLTTIQDMGRYDVRHDLTRVSATSNSLSLSDRPHKFFK